MFIVLGDSFPTLFERYLPQFPILANRTFVLLFIGILFVSQCLIDTFGFIYMYT